VEAYFFNKINIYMYYIKLTRTFFFYSLILEFVVQTTLFLCYLFIYL